MLRFYMDVFAAFPRMAKLAMDRIVADSYSREEESSAPHDPSTYYSVPTTADVAAYRGRSFQTTTVADLLYTPNGKCFEFTINPELFPEPALEAWGERRAARRLERVAPPKEDESAVRPQE